MAENKVFQIYDLKITVLSPVHIGDAYPFEPTNYIICKPQSENTQSTLICPECGYKNSIEDVRKYHCCGACEEPLGLEESSESAEDYLFTFTPKQLSESLSDYDKKLLLSVAKEGSYISLQKFFKEKSAKIAAKATRHAVVCPKIAKNYYGKFGNLRTEEKEWNQFIIEKNICNPATDIAYIPASSLKGAIRTALMSKRNESYYLNAEQYKNNRGKYDGNKAEKDLYEYNNPMEDPFKYLKVGDTIPINNYMTQICIAQNYNKKSAKNGIYTMMEVIPHGTVFLSQLMIDRRFAENIQSISKACNDFYGNRLTQDKAFMCDKHQIPPEFFGNINRALQRPNTLLLRLGKHSGAESVTIENMRHIYNVKSKQYMNSSTTCWFAENGPEKMPFGWCLAEFSERL